MFCLYFWAICLIRSTHCVWTIIFSPCLCPDGSVGSASDLISQGCEFKSGWWQMCLWVFKVTYHPLDLYRQLYTLLFLKIGLSCFYDILCMICSYCLCPPALSSKHSEWFDCPQHRNWLWTDGSIGWSSVLISQGPGFKSNCWQTCLWVLKVTYYPAMI